MRELLRRFLQWLLELLGIEEPLPVLPPIEPTGPFTPTLELVSLPGHGKSSYVWALLYTLRRMDLLLPDYVCWPIGDSTTSAMIRVHEAIWEHRLPVSNAGASEEQFQMELRRVGPYGTRRLALRDRRDVLFSPQPAVVEAAVSSNETRPAAPDVSWQVPVCWLLSLADLGEEEGAVLDLRLDTLIRQRRKAGHPQEATPIKLILVLTKADRLRALPEELRAELKNDPLWQAMKTQGETRLSDGQGTPSPARTEAAFKSYLERMWAIHLELQRWFSASATGRLFMERAKVHHIDVRFAMVSATGGAPLGTNNLGVPWTPRRVLDPILFCLDFELPGVRMRAA